MLADEPLPTTTTNRLLGDTPDCTAQDTNDRDSDGLNNYEECTRSMGTTSTTDIADHDADGLVDGLEVYQLGTDPKNPDTDGDWITETVEIKGFAYGNNTWYLNPLNLDTDGDGLPDSAECPNLTGKDALAADIGKCDTDHDQTPDPWDLDSDNDRVPDRMDLSPVSWVDQDGYHPTSPEDGSIAAFAAPSVPPGSSDPRFAFTVHDLQTDRPWPVLVDLQLRPVNAEHLSYAMSVLDWPETVTDGQIQHVRSSTFADQPDAAITHDDVAAHGDIQLVPCWKWR